MKIGFVVASTSRKAGGVFEAMRPLACTIAAQDYAKVEVFGLQDEFTEWDLWKWKPLQPRTFPIVGPRAYGYSPELSQALLRTDIDLIHAHGIWMYPSMASLSSVSRLGKPLIISPHGMLNPKRLLHSWWKKKAAGLLFENEHLKRASCIHALTALELNAVRDYGLKNPVCVIPNGIVTDDNTSANSKSYGPRNNVPKTLLYLGRLHPLKGLPNLLHAWKAVGDRNSSLIGKWQLAIVGWNQLGHEQELKTLSRTLGLEQSVSFLGPKFDSEKDTLLRQVDAFILPSIDEGLPMSILEAWAYSLPVLMTTSCNLPEGFDAEAAIRIGDDTESISMGLEVLFSMSEKDRLDMGSRGRSLVKTRFSWQRIANDWMAVYKWVLRQGEKPDCVMSF